MSETCRGCGKEFTDKDDEASNGELGESAVATTGGVVVPEDGFYMCDDPWDIYCEDCHAKRERAIDVAPELLGAAKEALEIFKGEWPEDDEVMGPVMIKYQDLINKIEGR